MPLSKLNQNQLEAASAPFGKNLVIASAGTGKTSTIVARIAHLLRAGVQPGSILLLTFTNKAAAEMVARLGKHFGKEIVAAIEAGTFHAVSYRWLKKLHENLVLKEPRELKMLFKTVYDGLAHRFKFLDSRAYSSLHLFELYSFYQNLCAEESFGAWVASRKEEQKELELLYEKIVEGYEAEKDELGFLGFNDLLLKMTKELKYGAANPFTEVLVDEYQDTNSMQEAFLDAMRPESLFCVGDYDQSIYSFNGADIRIIAGFATKHPDHRVFNLSKNYRSSSAILSLANKIISKNERLYEKTLEVVRTDVPSHPRLLIYDELFAQYQGIAKMIASSYSAPSEIAVIFRNNSSADGIEASLRELSVKCKRRGSSSFFDSREIRAVFDLMSVLINPKDVLSLVHIFEFAEGVGLHISKEIADALCLLGGGRLTDGLLRPDESVKTPFVKRNQAPSLFEEEELLPLGSTARFKHLNLPEALFANPVLKHPKLTEPAVKFLEHFYTFVKKYEKTQNPKTLLEAIRKAEIFGAIKTKLAKERALNKNRELDSALFDEAMQKIDSKVGLLAEIASAYTDRGSFVNAMVLGSSEMAQGEGVNLLSVHASKGLEFEEVFVIDLMDGRFPNRKLMNKSHIGDEKALEEERRLFYVAATRAKNHLSLSFAKYDKAKKVSYQPSLFLYEAGLVELEAKER